LKITHAAALGGPAAAGPGSTACQQPSFSSAPTPASSGGTDKLTVVYIALDATQMPSWVAFEIFIKRLFP
jgi:hypothetical protein